MNVINKVFAGYYYLRGLLLLWSPKFLDSIEYFNKAMVLSKNHPYLKYECNKYIGIAYCYNQNFKKAKTYLLNAEKHIKNQKPDVELFYFLGNVYEFEKDLQVAIKFYRHALECYRKNQIVELGKIEERITRIERNITG